MFEKSVLTTWLLIIPLSTYFNSFLVLNLAVVMLCVKEQLEHQQVIYVGSLEVLPTITSFRSRKTLGNPTALIARGSVVDIISSHQCQLLVYIELLYTRHSSQGLLLIHQS